MRGVETAITFARAGRASDETAIAFAGEKKLFFVHFSVAVVSAVSCWPASVAAEVLLVSKLARGRVLCAKKFALLGPVRTRARKSSPCTRKMAQNRRFVARWASFFAITPLERSRRAKFFAGLHKRPRAGRIKLCHRGSWHALWACAQVVDGLFMRLLSRPLGVVRIRWGICRPGWCGCGGGCRSLRSRWRPRCRPGRGW